MKIVRSSFEVTLAAYEHALGDYLRRNSEAGLKGAYDLGRKAMEGGLGILDMLSVHQRAVESLVSSVRSKSDVSLAVKDATIFLTETLGSFQMTHLGFRETLSALSARTAELESLNKNLSLEIGERIRAEQALRESQERYRNLVENARDVIYTLSADGHIASLNSAFDDFTGWRKSEWIGKRFADLLAPGDVSKHEAILRRLIRGEQPELFELAVRHKDGREIIAEFVVTPQRRNGSVAGVLGLARDVTERKKADEELRVSQARLAEAQRIARMGNWNWSMEEAILVWSTELNELLGPRPTPAGSAFRKYLSLVHPNDRRKVFNVVGQAVRRIEDFELSHRIVRPDGQTRVVHVTGKSVREKGGRATRMFGICQDITEAKRAEEIMKELPTRILQAQENERHRVSRELHDDVCQRLSAMRLGIDIMERGARRNKKVTEKIHSAKKQVDLIIKDIRRISWNLRPAMLDDLGLGAALKRLCDELARDHALRISLNTSGSVPTRFDNGLDIALYRIAQEAMMNTIKHAGAKKIDVQLVANLRTIRLTIADDGKGFDNSRERHPSGGHGLGLQSMKERVTLHHGTIKVVTRESEGTTIVAEIPLESGHVAPV